jgi:hypothetical protein
MMELQLPWADYYGINWIIWSRTGEIDTGFKSCIRLLFIMLCIDYMDRSTAYLYVRSAQLILCCKYAIIAYSYNFNNTSPWVDVVNDLGLNLGCNSVEK